MCYDRMPEYYVTCCLCPDLKRLIIISMHCHTHSKMDEVPDMDLGWMTSWLAGWHVYFLGDSEGYSFAHLHAKQVLYFCISCFVFGTMAACS